MGSEQTVQHDLREMAPSQTSTSSQNKVKLYWSIKPVTNLPLFESLYKTQKSQIFITVAFLVPSLYIVSLQLACNIKVQLSQT